LDEEARFDIYPVTFVTTDSGTRAVISEAMFKDAMRYRKMREFLDTLVIMDKDKGAMHFEDSKGLDTYVDQWRRSRSLLTPETITAHALKILEGQLTMTMKESRK
jgi:hypothetical protein